MSLEFGGKPKHPEKLHTVTGRTQILSHTRRLQIILMHYHIFGSTEINQYILIKAETRVAQAAY